MICMSKTKTTRLGDALASQLGLGRSDRPPLSPDEHYLQRAFERCVFENSQSHRAAQLARVVLFERGNGRLAIHQRRLLPAHYRCDDSKPESDLDYLRLKLLQAAALSHERASTGQI